VIWDIGFGHLAEAWDSPALLNAQHGFFLERDGYTYLVDIINAEPAHHNTTTTPASDTAPNYRLAAAP